jgi:glutathione synthase/RimK-type ligase-like ATP-grasp enzyme
LDVAFVDQNAILESGLDCRLGTSVTGALEVRGTTFDLDSISAAYVRPYDSTWLRVIQDAGPESSNWQHALDFDRLLWLWADHTKALVINRPSALLSNCTKPYQAAQIRRMGFKTPETLITTDKQAVEDFWEQHRRVIYKSIGGVRSIVSLLNADHRNRLRDVRWCPTQFQEYVEGLEHRVHVVGHEVFCCEVRSDATDYRYAERQGASVEMQPASLPEECADRCRRLTESLGLFMAGIDLRRTPDGAWYCFEVNPSPGFTFFDCDPDAPIADAVVRLMLSWKGPH